jgi:type IV pilus assembly protein PilE
MQSTPRKSSGFTLIELVIAMVIVSILATIAIPAYSTYVRKARRTDAKTALLDMASLEERYFSVNNSYSSTATDLGYASFPAAVGSGYYTVSVSNVNAATTTSTATYTLTATPTGDQLNDTKCLSFSVTQAGLQSSSPSTTCWQ